MLKLLKSLPIVEEGRVRVETDASLDTGASLGDAKLPEDICG